MRLPTRWLAGLSAVALLLSTAVAASGYTGQVLASISISITATAPCGTTTTATATILDANGAPVGDQSVDWSFDTSPSAADVIGKTPTTTDANGVTSTTVTFGPVAGTRTIRATAGDVSATAVVDPPCGGALPNTSTLPAQSPAAPAVPIVAMFLAFAVGGGLMLRRLATARR